MSISFKFFGRAKPAVDDSGGGDSNTAPVLELGDIEAVLSEFESPLLRYVEKVLGRASAQGEDIVQETFIRLYSQVAQKGKGSIDNPASWLFRVARNLCMDHLRRQKVDDRAKDEALREPGREVSGENGLELMLHREACSAAVEELGRLPAAEREVLSLKLFKDFKLREISHVTGMSLSMAGYRMNKALEILRERLKERGVL
jgi:RNA polymerase sigma-70 factor, ECF subfamily